MPSPPKNEYQHKNKLFWNSFILTLQSTGENEYGNTGHS